MDFRKKRESVMKKKTVVGVIPARYASTRFPGKVVAPILGKPLIQWVYENAKRAPSLDDVLVATDDERVMDIVRSFGGDAVMTSRDHISGTDRIWEAVEAKEVDIVVNIQGDEPLLQPESIDKLVKPLLEHDDIFITTLAFETENSEQFTDPNVVKVVTDEEGYALLFSRAPIPFDREEKMPVKWYKHQGVYAYRKDFLQWFASTRPGILERIEKLEQLRVLEKGFEIKVVLSNQDSLGVDVPGDVDEVEKRLKDTGI